MSYFDMILAKKLSGGGGGGGGSLAPFKGLIFDGQITTTMGNVVYESKGDFYLPGPAPADFEINGVTYANVPCQYNTEYMNCLAWGADEEGWDFSVYPFRYVQGAGIQETFYTQHGGTYDVKVEVVLEPTAAQVTFINQMEEDVWVSTSQDERLQSALPAGSTTVQSIPLLGGMSAYYEISDGQVSVSGSAYWNDQYSSLVIFGPATVTISP